MAKRKKRKRQARPKRRGEYTPGVSACCSRCGRVLAELPENATGEEWAAFFHFMDQANCPRCGAGFRQKAGPPDPPLDHSPPSGRGLLDRLMEIPKRLGF